MEATIGKSKIKQIKVKSSNVKSIGHDGKQTLEIVYLGKGERASATWRYAPVTPEQFEELKKAESKGKWVHANIRQNERIKGKKVE